MSSQSSKILIASSIGIASSGCFIGGNLGLSLVAIPALLIPSSTSSLPKPANAPNTESPSAVSTPKPAVGSGHLVRVWRRLYNIGKVGFPANQFVGTAAYLTAYYFLPAAANVQKRLLIAAAVINMAIVPYTFAVMLKTNKELQRREDIASDDIDADIEPKITEKSSIESYQTPDLVRWWATLNVIRALIPVGSVGCAIAALTD